MLSQSNQQDEIENEHHVKTFEASINSLTSQLLLADHALIKQDVRAGNGVKNGDL